MTLQVIGAGFGRTGTDSMREALTILGFGPCHHMMEVMDNATQVARWRAHVQGHGPGWESLFEGFRSAVDWPSAYYWRELVAVYPEAKVILTWRSAESWWGSFEQTILQGIQRSTDPASLGLALIRDRAFGGRPEDRDHAIAMYEANVAAVKAEVPAHRLLVHQAKDGWEPLCAHLGVAIPEVPYPSRNSSESMRAALDARLGPAR